MSLWSLLCLEAPEAGRVGERDTPIHSFFFRISRFIVEQPTVNLFFFPLNALCVPKFLWSVVLFFYPIVVFNRSPFLLHAQFLGFFFRLWFSLVS